MIKRSFFVYAGSAIIVLGGLASTYSYFYANSSKGPAPRLADREYVAAALMDIFGSEAHVDLKKGVLDKPDLFGGPCDPMEEIPIDKPSDSDSDDYSAIGNPTCERRLVDEKVKFTSKDTLLRKIAILSVCEKMVSNEKTFLHAMNVTSPQELPPFDEDHKKMIYKKFYPLDDKVENIKKDLPKTADLAAKWKKWTLAVCASPGWQIL
jgi:hypothetical protein